MSTVPPLRHAVVLFALLLFWPRLSARMFDGKSTEVIRSHKGTLLSLPQMPFPSAHRGQGRPMKPYQCGSHGKMRLKIVVSLTLRFLVKELCFTYSCWIWKKKINWIISLQWHTQKVDFRELMQWWVEKKYGWVEQTQFSVAYWVKKRKAKKRE